MAQPPLIRPESLLKTPAEPSVRGRYFVQTWGCQMNDEDSEQIGLYLEAIGFERALRIQEAQVVLLNTCSVRKKPEDKAFSLLGELKFLKDDQPSMVIGVCGCMAQIRAAEIHQRAPHVDFVVGTAQIAQIPGLVEEAVQKHKFQKRMDLPERKGSIVIDLPERVVPRAQKLKTFVPIQYGCDKFCSFCVVPHTRGRERSRPTWTIIDEVTKLAEQGTREVTLLGQTVNSYGKNLAEGRVPFAELLWKLADIEGLQRIRFVSPYPRDFKDDLVAAIKDCPKVMEHCHLPLQAGHDDLLKRMKRVYTVEGFMDIVARLRTAAPDISLTTDIIVGFPGETDEEFEGTLEVVRKVRFDGAFMFRYSPRPNTPAAEMEQVNQEVSKERQITLESNEAWVGRDLEVLVEGPSPKNPNMLQGYSREFRMMHFKGPESLVGQTVSVRATRSHPWGLSGKIG